MLIALKQLMSLTKHIGPTAIPLALLKRDWEGVPSNSPCFPDPAKSFAR